MGKDEGEMRLRELLYGRYIMSCLFKFLFVFDKWGVLKLLIF